MISERGLDIEKPYFVMGLIAFCGKPHYIIASGSLTCTAKLVHRAGMIVATHTIVI